MQVTVDNFPAFDILEATIDRDLSYKNYQSLKPVKTGQFISRVVFDFAYARWKSFSNGVADDSFVATKQLHGKPLVISFYSKHWNAKGISYLKQLSALHEQVKANGGNLVIINTEACSEDLTKLVVENNLSLNFYFDQANKIAETLGVYSENDPIWNWFAGIDLNVPLLSTFVIGVDNNVVFDHNHRDYDERLSVEDLLSAVGESSFISKLLLSA